MEYAEAKYTLHGDLSGRFRLQQDLKCKHYDWFLENIYPESEMVVDSYHIGQVWSLIEFLRRRRKSCE